MKPHPLLQRLEQYTLKRPAEVLLVTATVGQEDDQVIIFRGFSSSLMRSTAFDPDVPILDDQAEIVLIDRLEGPYMPENPVYIQQGLTESTVESLLGEVGV
jgi:hypothetical protein